MTVLASAAVLLLCPLGAHAETPPPAKAPAGLVEAAPAATNPVPFDTEHAIEMVAVGETGWDAIRYEVNSGKSWKLSATHWVEMSDPVPLPRSRYRVQMVALTADWGAIRFDTRSGRSWRAVESQWKEIPETAPPSPAE